MTKVKLVAYMRQQLRKRIPRSKHKNETYYKRDSITHNTIKDIYIHLLRLVYK